MKMESKKLSNNQLSFLRLNQKWLNLKKLSLPLKVLWPGVLFAVHCLSLLNVQSIAMSLWMKTPKKTNLKKAKKSHQSRKQTEKVSSRVLFLRSSINLKTKLMPNQRNQWKKKLKRLRDAKSIVSSDTKMVLKNFLINTSLSTLSKCLLSK